MGPAVADLDAVPSDRVSRWKLASRVLVPSFMVRLYYGFRHRTLVSPRAEVDWSSETEWGPGCVISAFVKIKIGGPFTMGESVQIGAGCFIAAGRAGLHIGDHVLIGPNCTVLTGNYRYDRLDVPLVQQGTTGKGVRIGRYTWVGANSVVLDGSEVGENVIIGAGSVVSGRVPANSIVQGSPAKVIFTRR